MNFSVLMLADHATVADGLLYVNGGCLNNIARPAFPAPLGAMLAAAITVPAESINKPINFTLSMHAVNGEESIFRIDAEIVAGLKEGVERLPYGNAFVVDLRPAPVPAPGSYVVEARVGEIAQHVYFTAIELQSEDKA
ncbi:DUF6941 family protein [Nocardia sp. CA-119907]|uniref:DUF6941 family protein n=1 Tax=Nocardia sp. CA-119907 TaxID=3239973 RepID=UPI003D970B9B